MPTLLKDRYSTSLNNFQRLLSMSLVCSGIVQECEQICNMIDFFAATFKCFFEPTSSLFGSSMRIFIIENSC